jgi:hypothetical protein
MLVVPSRAGSSDEREVEHRDLAGLDQAGHLAKVIQPVARPGRAVDDQPLGVLEQIRRLARSERRLARPPHRDRQVVDEERLDDRRDVPPGVAAGRDVDRLGAGLRLTLAGEHAIGRDPGVEPTGAVGIGRRADQGARGMTAGELRDDRRAVLADLRPASDDDQVHHARPGRDMTFLVLDVAGHRGQRPDLGQLALDPVDRRRTRHPAQGGFARLGRAEIQIRRHRRPSRAISTSASGGPHVPAA